MWELPERGLQNVEACREGAPERARSGLDRTKPWLGERGTASNQPRCGSKGRVPRLHRTKVRPETAVKSRRQAKEWHSTALCGAYPTNNG